MTGHERAGYRRRLQNLLRRVGGTVHELRDDRRDGAPVETLTDAGDFGEREYDEQVELAVAGTEKQLLGEVEAAPARIDAGTFGRCGSRHSGTSSFPDRSGSLLSGIECSGRRNFARIRRWEWPRNRRRADKTRSPSGSTDSSGRTNPINPAGLPI